MKKLLILLTAACLVTGLGFAQTQTGADKGKGKGKKTPTHNCPGKECSKKKG
jgi:hypothetical protein